VHGSHHWPGGCGCLQFEDPSPGLQQLREKLELQMLLGCPWVVAAAEQAAAAAAAGGETAGQKRGEGSTNNAAAAAAASGSAGKDVSNAGNPLQLPSSIRDRIVTELKIHTPQVSRWQLAAWHQDGCLHT
jgi:hypothetical protein